MDLAKLDKMKVVDLRTELQTRGLDTKGVKAVLIERLRAHVEGGAGGGDGADGAPLTPSRRQRRTRSMSRSPSPVAAAPVATEPNLETLEEEEQPATAGHESEVDAKPAAVAEIEQADEEDEEEDDAQEQEEESNNMEQEQEEAEEEETDAAGSTAASQAVQNEEDVAMTDEANKKEEEADQESNDSNQQAQPDETEEEHDNPAAEADSKANAHQSNGDTEKMEVDEDAANATVKTDEQTQQDKDNSDQAKTTERRKRSHSNSRSRSNSRSPKRRSGDKRDSKAAAAAAEERTVAEDEPTIAENQVGLSWLDSDLHLRIDTTNFTSAKPLTAEIYSLIWSGARANYGVREGKVCFEVRLSEESVPENSHHFRDEPNVRGFRVGFSTPKSSMLLGEAEHSFGYCENGRKANNGEFTSYGKPYQLDDVIGCYLDLESTPCNIKYTLNGEDLGVAHEFDKSILGEEEALFPHIVTKGYEFTVNFANGEELLVNAERPTRKRRKQRAESPKDDVNDGDKWKVLDEATADDDELEKKEDDSKPADAEKSDEGDKPEDKADTTETAEDEQSKEADADEEAQSEQAQPAEAAEVTQDQAVEPAEAAAEVPPEAAAVANGDSQIDAEKSTEEADSKAEIAAAPKEVATTTANVEEEDEDGPSPNKRVKTDAETDKAASEKPKSTEEEYEDVVPVPRDTVTLLPGYILLALVPTEQLIAGPQRAESRKQCEVILLVGLPGAGKTHWTQKHVSENLDKRYEIIGPDTIIAKMTIDGESRKTVHKGRWDKVYEICLNSLGALEDIAMKRRRNFILDQRISHCPHWSLDGSMTSSTRS
ncbi:heterogeneous nuclear ribonucleoprotein U isoform X4 [Drosophila sulfurigaster albostrigata]|uniref:heterogeneous nuclear ribonucleoprotein U isoform X4 n=1 Tax=Drosophila sulfurigaster albostrigata TaxID=89887 RepID=UPI002D219C58|nr:heterogeneous nuclear ribonucleoprotein U isoform X4 [Drosophila sulfurigaster albostrigata]